MFHHNCAPSQLYIDLVWYGGTWESWPQSCWTTDLPIQHLCLTSQILFWFIVHIVLQTYFTSRKGRAAPHHWPWFWNGMSNRLIGVMERCPQTFGHIVYHGKSASNSKELLAQWIWCPSAMLQSLMERSPKDCRLLKLQREVQLHISGFGLGCPTGLYHTGH